MSEIQRREDFEMVVAPGSGMVAVEQTRAIAEVQASLVIAKSNPRNEAQAERAIMNACKRESLAKSASFSFKRGGTLVTGPSIRLAEVLARAWGNMQYGYREVSRGSDYSEIEAFAHDLQTNTRVTRQFQVKHIRDKTSGNVALTAERDKYEHVASQAQRRVRACVLEIIPGDITEMAVEACDATLNSSIGDIRVAAENIVTAFAALDVTKDDIEAYLQRKLTSLVPADIISLRKIYNSIKTGIAGKEEFFTSASANLNKKFTNPPAKPPEKKKAEPKPKEEKPPEDLGPDLGPEPPPQDYGPIDGEMIACPEAGGMKVLVADCTMADCSRGCAALRTLQGEKR
jgi:hypothetical protein